ncbi:MAG TPA: cytochrome c1 [Devosiaceae bacterium]|nr:cytochrome c1 [Devosiaceae bacterium]
MIQKKNILSALVTGLLLATAPVMAQDNAAAPAAPASAPATTTNSGPAANSTTPESTTAQPQSSQGGNQANPTAGNNANAPSQPGTGAQSSSPATGAAGTSPSTNNAEQGATSAGPVEPVNLGEAQVPTQSWSFAGIFGRYDQNQLRRGFQIFKEVCSNCHSANLLSFRNLGEPGGPEYSAAQVKALAATYTVADPSAPGGKRPALPSDRWPAPFATEQDARDANGGALPPDWSVLAKARGAKREFPWWVFDYFTTYQEGGPDYIHALMTGYHEQVPAGVTNADGTPFKLPEGKYYNDYFPGHAIGMPPPLSDGLIKYEPGADGSTVPETVDQYARDVAAFMMWLAEPGLDSRKEAGFRVITFLLLFAVIMWMVKRRIWSNVEH